VTTARHTGSGRALTLATAALCLCACAEPEVGARVAMTTPSEGPRIVVEDATVNLHGHVVVTFVVTQDDLPLSLADVTALAPRFTLATLSTHPVDGLPAWTSQLLTGSQTATSLPPAGPGTPAALVVAGARQPGAESGAAFDEIGPGRFRYVFQATLAADPDDTVRVGVYLRAAPRPSLRTATTHDFRPSGGPMEARDTVLDERCNGCHGNLVAHDGRAGVRLCLTCHTWQCADPDTIDPAALVTAATTAGTDPNPLELGRLVHRIHRGRTLPTLYASSSRANPAPALAAGNDLPLPFSPENSTTLLLGRKYSIVGYRSRELVGGRIVQRADNGLPPRTLATGVAFPRDLRDCAVCHAGAPQASVVSTAISRRICAGCHPDSWFQAAPAVLDEGHFAHPGGAQPDDTRCATCHVTAPEGSRLYAPVALLHVPIPRGARYDALRIELLAVDGLTPGGRPAVRFRVVDRTGALAPTLGAPEPAAEPDSATSSFVPRALGSLGINVAGATAPDYGPAPTSLLTSGARGGNPDPLQLAVVPGTDEYVYTFTSTVPPGAVGTWAVGMEARRRLKYGHYDPASDTFRWPGTGETVTESPENPVVYVDTATGVYRANEGRASPGATPRRKVVSEQGCLRCHGRLEQHGRQRHQVEYCLLCHTPTRTDYPGRKKTPRGFVDLAATLDGLEERSVHLKVMVHRLHTGDRAGAASLEALEPFVMGGSYRDEVRFPGDLRDCTRCHLGNTFQVEAVPADAPPTVANETATILHAAGSAAHVAAEPARPPIQAACTGCHATGATFAHVAAKTVAGVETCAQCHAKGALAVAVVHGLEPLVGTAAGASFSSIAQAILTPRCATTACHASGGTPPVLEGPGAYAAVVGAASAQSPLRLVEPGAPERSYLVHKLRGTAGDVGGIGTLMPTDGALAPADVAAVEAWISEGAPND
jgi:OmcA/MtrC family decaheme c-type cytochrome